ncbi:hypothetical protein AVEN_4073-1, partial [Araneus ventricosus]
HSKRPQLPSGKVSVSRPEGSRLETPILQKIRRVWRPLHATQWPNVLPLVWCGSLERVPAKVSPLSSDHGSK